MEGDGGMASGAYTRTKCQVPVAAPFARSCGHCLCSAPADGHSSGRPPTRQQGLGPSLGVWSRLAHSNAAMALLALLFHSGRTRALFSHDRGWERGWEPGPLWMVLEGHKERRRAVPGGKRRSDKRSSSGCTRQLEVTRRPCFPCLSIEARTEKVRGEGTDSQLPRFPPSRLSPTNPQPSGSFFHPA